jgi:diacylglycerol kinase (ATP)
LFLLNPVAGRGRAARSWRKLESLMIRDGFPYELVLSGQKGGIARAMEQACREGRERVVIIGGDGSMHEAVNGLMAAGLAAGDLPLLSLLPAGSGNDWATWWGLPSNPQRWWQEAQAWPAWYHNAGRIHYQREGKACQAWFLNVAGMAYDAWVVRRIEEHPGSKGNAFIYILSVLRWLSRYRPQSATVKAGDRIWQGRFYTINAGICPFSGGGMRLVPHARPDHDGLALTIAGDLPLPRILLNLWRFYHPSIGRVRDVDTLFAPTLEVCPDDRERIEVEADGEWLGHCPCQVALIPAAFRVAAPGRRAKDSGL